MGFEQAIILSYLGVSFILAYIASKLSDETIFLVALKILLFAGSIIFLIPMFSFNISLLDYANETAGGLSTATYANLSANLDNGLGHLFRFETIISIFVFFIFLWWMFSFVRMLIDKYKKEQNRGFEEFERLKNG